MYYIQINEVYKEQSGIPQKPLRNTEVKDVNFRVCDDKI